MRLNLYRDENVLQIANDINVKENYGCKSEQIPSRRNGNFIHKMFDSLNLSTQEMLAVSGSGLYVFIIGALLVGLNVFSVAEFILKKNNLKN